MKRKPITKGRRFTLNTADPKAVLFVNDHAPGIIWAWYDLPRKGEAVFLRVHSVDAIEVKLLENKDDPLRYSEELNQTGWRPKQRT